MGAVALWGYRAPLPTPRTTRVSRVTDVLPTPKTHRGPRTWGKDQYRPSTEVPIAPVASPRLWPKIGLRSCSGAEAEEQRLSLQPQSSLDPSLSALVAQTASADNTLPHSAAPPLPGGAEPPITHTPTGTQTNSPTLLYPPSIPSLRARTSGVGWHEFSSPAKRW